MEPDGEDHGGGRSVQLTPGGDIMPTRILSSFRNLLRKLAVEQALEDELRSSVEALAQEKVKQGLSQSGCPRRCKRASVLPVCRAAVPWAETR
jgi:hypothetical protein